MPQQDPSRTEKATTKRRKKAREEGNVPKSEEVSKVVVLMIGILCMRIFIENVGTNILDIYHFCLDSCVSYDLSRNNLLTLFFFSLKKMASMLWPMMLFLLVASFLSVRLQVGHLFTTKVFQPKLGEKFNVVNGLKKTMFSMKTIVNAFKTLFQISIVAGVAFLVIRAKMDQFLPLFYQNIEGIVSGILSLIFQLFIYALIPIFLIAIVHLFYTRWDYEENLKMTKQEVKDEHKQSYGNPEIKQEQRKKMQGFMQNRMMEDVPKADVVVTNPVHLAVALGYDPTKAPAPMVMAKGSEKVAERIKEIARENQVPIRENPPLAQALYKSVEIGECIPEELYQAVASILAQLYKFRNRN